MTEQETIERLREINLRLLKELDRVCRKYDIQYFLAYGSLLGAVRHHGFIPWDDDVDVWMDRKNYKKLLEHKDEFGENYEFMRPDDYGKYYDYVPRLTYKYAHFDLGNELNSYYNNKLNRLHADVFLIDKTYSDIRGKLQLLELLSLYGLMNAYRAKEFSAHQTFILHLADSICRVIGKIFSPTWLLKMAAKVAFKYADRPDTDAVRVTADSLAGIKRSFPKSAFENVIYMDFEDMKAPVPGGYDAILKIIYNDYMTPPPKEKQVLHWGPVPWARSNEAIKYGTIDANAIEFDEPEKEER